MPRRDRYDVDKYADYCSDYNIEYINHKLKNTINNEIIDDFLNMNEEDLLDEYYEDPVGVESVLNNIEVDNITIHDKMILEIYTAFKEYKEDNLIPILSKLNIGDVDNFLYKNLNI